MEQKAKQSGQKKAFGAPVTAEEMTWLPGREAREKRTRGGKIYDLGRNLHQAVLFADPVHYRSRDTGAWEEIDNTLERRTDALGGAYLTNRANDELRVQFRGAAEDETIVLEDGEGHRLAWRLEGAGAVPPVHAEDARSVQRAVEPRRAVLSRLEDEVTYPEILPGVTMRCRIQSVSFKDELVFSTPESVRPITFRMTLPGLLPEKREDGRFELSAGGRTAFTLPAPFLKDSGEGGVGRVECEMAPTEEADVWRMTCVPDAAWVETASYPVILDPAVTTVQHSSAIEDNFVTSVKPTALQTYKNTNLTVSCGHKTHGTSRAFIRFLDASLPAIDSSYYVTRAILGVTTKTAPSPAASVYLKEVLEDWSSQTITWTNQPKLSDKPLDYAYMEKVGTTYYYDVSNLVRKWYGGTNYGVALEAASSTYMELYSSDYKYAKPCVTINYVSLAGLEDYLAYEDQDVGQAGVGHVSLYNGNLIFERQDTVSSGERAPVSLKHIYNSCYRQVNDFGAGRGWKLNVQKTLHREDVGENSFRYVYTDADGTRHHFAQTNNVWKDQDGLGLTLTVAGETATITDKGDNAMTFDLPKADWDNSYANVKLVKSIADACGNTIAVNAVGLKADCVTDGAGRQTGIVWSSGAMAVMQPPGYHASGYCGFTYDGAGRLTKVTETAAWSASGWADVSYAYDGNGLLTSATNVDGLTVSYEYYTAREPYRVKRVRITNEGLVGMDRQYEYRDCLTVVTDSITGKKLFYHFNDCGNVVSVNDELGYACFAQYSDSLPVNHPAAVSKLQRSVVNLLSNHSFEENIDWSTESYGGEGTYTPCATDQKYIGACAMKVEKANADGNMCVYRQFDGFTVGQTYTFSAYIRTKGSVYAYATALFGSNQWHNGAHMASTDRWVRISTTFTATAASGSLYLVTMGGAGTVWIDCAQLEEGPVANRYNMLVNGDFTLSGEAPVGWTANSSNNPAVDKVYAGSTGVKPAGLSRNTLRLYGEGRTKYPGVYQDIRHSGAKGDVYVAGGWSASFSMPRKDGDTGNEFRYNIRVAFHKKGRKDWDKEDFESAPSIRWSDEWTDWQFAAGPVIAPVDYDGIRFNVDYERNINYAEFGGLFLHKEEFGQSFTYDANGNVTSTKNAASLRDGATYDAFNNVLTYFQPGRGTAEKTTLEWGATDAEKKKHLLRKSASPLGTVNEYAYDAYGNQLTAKTSGGGMFMQTSTAYTADGNHVQTETDARGKQVQRETDAALDTLKSVTDPRGQKVAYAYDANRRVTQTTALTAGGAYVNAYAYTKDKLTQVRHNNTADGSQSVAYSFAYDVLNRPTYVQVGTQTLSTTSYNVDGTVSGIDYGNGGKVRNAYDGFKRVTGVYYDDETEPHFSYTYGANGEVAQVVDNVRDVTVRSAYDLANRPMCKAIIKNGTPESPEASARQEYQEYLAELLYDKYNNLSTFREEVGALRAGHTTAFAYDSENRPTTICYDSKPGETRQATYAYDGLGRVTQRTVNAGRATVDTSFTYVSGPYGTGSTTPLVESMTQLTRTLKYTYDNAGNITSVTQGDKTVRYTYDTLGQLIRVDDPNDLTTSFDGTTWVFTYDFGGNILTKKGYAYTTGTVGAIQRSYAYTYGDANWKDKLTAINGDKITSDAIGNPLSDGTWTYKWAKGRQLRSMNKTGTSIAYTYNEDGLRVGKNVNGTVTNYVLHGKNVVHLTRGGDSLHFYYGADGHPTVVEYNGVSYSYAYNLQGDVISLQDADGWTQVQYAYDAWGQPIGKTGAMANTLGTLNPFRYRGYIYDEETGFYYVSSRYYNPAVGRWINADDVDCLGAEGALVSNNLFAYCLNNPVNRTDVNGNWSLPNWAKVVIGAVATVAAVAITVATGGAAAPVLLRVATSTVGGAAIGAITHRVTTGSWDGAGKAALDGAADGFMVGGLGVLGGSVIGRATRTIKNARSGITIGKGNQFKEVAEIAQTRYYSGLNEFKYIEKKLGTKAAETVGWWQNKCIVKGVMALKGPIYDCGGALTGAYAKEVALTKGYKYLYNVWLM